MSHGNKYCCLWIYLKDENVQRVFGYNSSLLAYDIDSINKDRHYCSKNILISNFSFDNLIVIWENRACDIIWTKKHPSFISCYQSIYTQLRFWWTKYAIKLTTKGLRILAYSRVHKGNCPFILRGNMLRTGNSRILYLGKMKNEIGRI